MLRNSLKSIFPAEVMAEDELLQRRPEQLILIDFTDLMRRAANL
ncbi:MAG: hypothetical protein WA952_04780 [Lewinella sp.]